MNPVRDKNMWYVYVLKSQKDGNLYTGFTGDLRKRLRQHEKGESNSTKNRGPFTLIYYEASNNEEDARAREKYLKSGMGKRYINNRLKRFLSLTG
ncbi:MAG: GIY-YIG nuclease superfamily protein [Parcubacteria group bacterium GW2011_GWD2_42_14]|nr:MAG: GIY-YIG nuclease superfamily protein [Parcubacteria group bacterium GW2011_GWD2_42_14]